MTTVTARLDHGSSEAVTITVSLSPVSSTGAVAGDYTQSTTNTLTIAAGATASTGLVTVTAADNTADEPDIRVTVSGAATGGRGVANPAAKTLTIRDDDGAPLVTLLLSAAGIDESGASNCHLGDGDALPPVERGDHGDGGGGAGCRRGGGELPAFGGEDADHRGRRQHQHGHGDGDGGERRHRCAEQERDDLGARPPTARASASLPT